MGFDTPYKPTLPGKVFEPASSLAASYPSTLAPEPFAKSGRTQDTVFNGRRCLVSQHMGGCDEWLTDNAATGGGAQTKPDDDTWRTVCRARTELMPGSVLVARVIAVPSGATEYYNAGTGTYENDGNQGAARFVIDYDNVDADSDSVTVEFELPASQDADGIEDAAAGAAWSQLQHHVAPIVRPAACINSPSDVAKWSEWPTITVAVGHRGGARVVHASLCEEPYEHIVADTVTDASSCNGVGANLHLLDKYPIEKTSDGATYGDPRFGTHRMLDVANRQTQRLGPRICHFSAYGEELTEVTDTETDAIQITSATYVRVSWRDANANTAWDADAPGFDILPARRAPENLSSRLSGAAVAPVRLRVYARFSAAGANTGVFKVQSSSRCSVSITISQATVGTTWTWLTITGFLETNIASDDNYCIVQDWAKTTGGSLEIMYWDLSYGDFAVGA
jgi:hypothetical protein